jgi:hypothetical protein
LGGYKVKARSLLIVAAFAISSCSTPSGDQSTEPHWVKFTSPHETWGLARIAAPTGHQLCGIGSSYSRWEPVLVFLDRNVRCEAISIRTDFEQLPDFIMIQGGVDAALTLESTADYAKSESFFCHDDNVSAAIKPAGKVLAGLETDSCVRDDQAHHVKALVAYRPMSDQIGETYLVGAYVRPAYKQRADALVDEIARSIRLLRSSTNP